MPQAAQQQQQQQQQQIQGPAGVEHIMVRAANPMQQVQLPPGAAPPGHFVRNPMVQPQQRVQWQVRHPQEVTLQQRGPIGASGPTMIVGQRLPIGAGMIATPMQMSEAQASVPNQPPAPLNMPPATPPPDNPQTEDDHQKVSLV